MSEWKTRVTKAQVVKPARELGEACLVLIYPPGPDMGKRFPLQRSEVVLGRGGDCDVQVDRDSVSRRHARVYRSGEGWFVEDLQSTNGSYVNDVPVTKSPLRDGDFVKIGAAIFKFLRGTGIEASYHEEIYKMTIVDALTGAHNKRYFLEFLEREIARCARYHRPLSLLMFDIDHFKAINDKHGHLTGDYVLREMSHRLLHRVRREELLARYGGEEFAAVLPETNLNGAREFGEQIRRVVSDQPFEYEGDTFPVTVSVGVACVEGQDVDVPTFIKIADENLYRAKREGRNRVVAGSPTRVTRPTADHGQREGKNRVGADIPKWPRWNADPAFRSQVSSKMAVVALSLLARDQILASSSGVAYVDDLEGLLYAHLREQQRPEQAVSFGALEGGSKLLVGVEGRNPTHRLRAILFESLRGCAEERPEARFAVGPIALAREGDRALEDTVAGLDEEIRVLENGHHLPQPIAVVLRALEGVTSARAKSVLELGEALLQWMVLCMAAELSINGGASKTFAALRRGLGEGTTVERWLEVLITGIEELLKLQSVHAAAWRACFDNKSARGEVVSWLSSFVELRNAFARDATARDEHIARKLVDETAPRLRQLVKRELRAVLALIPAEVELIGFEGELQSYRMTRLIGDGVAAPVSVYSRRRMNPGLWLCDTLADRAIPLEPFFVRDTCPKCGARELFLLTRLDELEYRNPASGHVLKKPIDDMPFSPAARERLLELAGPANVDEPLPPRDLETAKEVASSARHPGKRTSRQPRDFKAAQEVTRVITVAQIGATLDGHSGSHPVREPSRPRPAPSKHTILFLAANPIGTDRSALDREVHAIQVELERSGFRDCFELVTRWAAEPIDLLRELRRLKPTVIHFSGHGRQSASGEHQLSQAPPSGLVNKPGAHEDKPEHGLYFQGPDGRAQLVSTSALKETFSATNASVKLMVLSACYSEPQAKALIAHVDCVVGIGGAIRDDVARNFAIGFYGGLAERESIAAAYRQGCAAISLEGLRDAERPQLKVRTGVDAAKLVLAAKLP
ncbi:MAG TPA: diguanylate cyclase [Kofleriaceae bacterium]|nr:diguanylate cyclase [Kofleriaceae bacterium]